MDGDKFVSTNKDIFRNQDMFEDDNNFFVQKDKVSVQKLPQTEPLRRINDYDSNILQEGAYREVDNEIFKLEYKISKIENEISEVNKNIQMAEEIHDYTEIEKLNAEKAELVKELELLKKIYNEASLSAKISEDFVSKIRDRFVNTFDKVVEFGMFLLSKSSGKISSIIEVKQALVKLENINKSLDDLMKSRYPYGEAAEKYEQLSKYIARANSIQSEIYGFMK